MTSVLLIYPYFMPSRDRSIFRFPPLGVGYVAASLLAAGHKVHILDCTFRKRENALNDAIRIKAEVVGIYCMVTMIEDCLWIAKRLRNHCKLLIAGGPLPTCDPIPFLKYFDVVVRGEGEKTIQDILRSYEEGMDLSSIRGISYRTPANNLKTSREDVSVTEEQSYQNNLDIIPFPARHLFPNESYIRYGKKKYGYSITTVMSTRGCPYRCEFCSNVIFGGSYRERSPENVVDEIEEAIRLGYDRIAFADDVFTLNRRRVLEICQEIHRRGLEFQWECLGRADTLDYLTSIEMKKAGCARIYFGIESGSDQILKLMKKNITTEQARNAVEAAHRAGLEIGAFFILFYPGETDDTVLETLRFAKSLPLDYLGLTIPYPLPGTALYERVKHQIYREWRPDRSLRSHELIYNSDFSEAKMWFGIIKGHMEFKMARRLGKAAPFFINLFEKPTDVLLRLLR